MSQPQGPKVLFLPYLSEFSNDQGEKKPEKSSCKASTNKNNDFNIGFVFRACKDIDDKIY